MTIQRMDHVGIIGSPASAARTVALGEALHGELEPAELILTERVRAGLVEDQVGTVRGEDHRKDGGMEYQ